MAIPLISTAVSVPLGELARSKVKELVARVTDNKSFQETAGIYASVITKVFVSVAIADLAGAVIGVGMEATQTIQQPDMQAHVAPDPACHYGIGHTQSENISALSGRHDVIPRFSGSEVEFPDGTKVTDPYTDSEGSVYKNRSDWLSGNNPYTIS